MRREFKRNRRMRLSGAVVLLALICLSSNAIGQQQPTERSRVPLRALYIPLADHYAGIVAHEKYRDQMEVADYQIERMGNWPTLRAAFLSRQADLAYVISPMAMDMYANSPTFQWVSLLHRDGNALAINDILNQRAQLAGNRRSRQPTDATASALQYFSANDGRPVECGVPSLLSTHTVILYKYLRDHGKTLSLGTNSAADVLALPVAPPKSPLFIKQHDVRGIPACLEQSLPWADVVETQGFGRIAWYSRDVLHWPEGHVECIAIAQNTAIQNKSEAIKEVVYYLHQAGQDIEAARERGGAGLDSIVEMIRKHIPEHTPAAIRQSLRRDLDVINYRHLNVDEGGLKQVMDLALEGGILKQPIDITSFANHDYRTQITTKRHGSREIPPSPTIAATNVAVSAEKPAALSERPDSSEKNEPLLSDSVWILAILLSLAGFIGIGVMHKQRLKSPSEKNPAIGLARSIKRNSAWSGVFSTGLSRTLLIRFLLLALLPLLVVSAISYFSARESLRKQAEALLSSTVHYKHDAIDNHFSDVLRGLTSAAEDPTYLDFLTQLSLGLNENNGNLGRFVNSVDYEQIVAKHGHYLEHVRHLYGYYDILLLDAQGNILFTVAREKDLGTNIFRDQISNNNLLAQTCQKVLSDGSLLFSDFYRYAYSGNTVSGFLVAPIVDSSAKKAGLLAFQFDSEQLDNILRTKHGLGETGEAYLLGQDMRMRSNSPLESHPTILGEPVSSGLTESWTGHLSQKLGNDCDWGVKSYRGRRDQQVLGAHDHIEVAGVPYLVVAEIEESEALLFARNLLFVVLGLLLFTAIVVGLIGAGVSRRIVTPLLDLSSATKEVAVGNLEVEIQVAAKNEIGGLAADFEDMIKTFKNIADHCAQVARGQFGAGLEVKGENDLLTPEINSMIAYLEQVVSQADTIANGNYSIFVEPRSDSDRLAQAINRMTASLKESDARTTEAQWLKTGQTEMLESMRGVQDQATLCRSVVTHLAKYVDAQVGLLYVEKDGILTLAGSFAHMRRKHLANEFAVGEGLVGQAALEQQPIVLTKVPDNYIQVSSGLGESPPQSIIVQPLVLDGKLYGCLEFGSLEPFSDLKLALIGMATENISIAINAVRDQERVRVLLGETQQQAEVLQNQQEELRAANEELEEQTMLLKESESKLLGQQEELRVTNEELEENTDLLSRQKRSVELAQRELTLKADQLALSSKYKSEFLANMSHELRTPLNSLLLLARSLTENREGNLTEEQVESASVIYQGGNDLLSLINEILDLSKIEAGRMDLHLEEVELSDLVDSIQRNFRHVAEDKNLELTIKVDRKAPNSITTDRKRLAQVLKNLVSNAIKFTEKGSVRIAFSPTSRNVQLQSDIEPTKSMQIRIEDTGIGVSDDQKDLIFEAFQQVDGSTARQYEGTGLGLSIARELAGLLGGEIQLRSRLGKGSVFTVYLPTDGSFKTTVTSPAPLNSWTETRTIEPLSPGQLEFNRANDDRGLIKKGDRSILFIEDDSKFAEILATHCRRKGLKVLLASSGEEGVELTRQFLPMGIVLDLKLPGISGHHVLELIKTNPRTRHIPVHVITMDETSSRVLKQGAIGHLQKPVTQEQIDHVLSRIQETATRKQKRVLVVEDDSKTRMGIIKLISDEHIVVDEAEGVKDAHEALQSTDYDCIILDLELLDASGDSLLKEYAADETKGLPPVIVYTGKELTEEDAIGIREYSDSIIIKDVRSDERLLDEVTLFLHSVVEEMPETKRQLITNLHDTDQCLHDKKVLIVDDDMRASFALTRLLSERKMQVLRAENGKRALEMLETEHDVDLILMDIMMPVLDGYETMKRIRSHAEHGSLPIIALTAKAMKDDQHKCLKAGANDYLPKPIDQDRLLSMLRVWMYPTGQTYFEEGTVN